MSGCRDDVAIAVLGWGQWTLYNTLFLLVVVQAHNGNVWRGHRFVNWPLWLEPWLPAWARIPAEAKGGTGGGGGGAAGAAGEGGGQEEKGGRATPQPERLIIDAPM